MKISRPKSKQPMPESAKRVFKGVLFDTYQWEQELYDGSTATFEKVSKLDGVNVFPVTDEGKIVLSKQRQPLHEPFEGALGGHIDAGETPLQAAKRELLEEAGMEAESYQLWFASQPSAVIEWAIYSFVAKGCKKVGEPTPDPGENIELVEVDFAGFVKTAAGENYRDLEVAVRVFRASQQKEGLKELRKLFME